ncbi:aminotransferase class V-fold PLP-dependent enzyme [Fusibacter bizertensis]
MFTKIPFHTPFENKEVTKRTLERLGNQKCNDLSALYALEEKYSTLQYANRDYKTYFTQSATQALEMMALSLDFSASDEVIMPSYTYAATANAFARTGAKIVFADIERDTLNISERTVAPLITDHTRAIIPIHYGGCAADMSSLKKLIEGRHIYLLEDAAHGIGALYGGKPLGTIGEMGCISFHHTKNIHAAGSGGVLYIQKDKQELIEACDHIYHQGTNRLDFLSGNSSNYSWQSLGGEYQMSNYHAIYLAESLKYIEEITQKRRRIFERYREGLMRDDEKWQAQMNLIKVIEGAEINGHIFPVVLSSSQKRDQLKAWLYENGIETLTHYEPLHESKAGKKYGVTRSAMNDTLAVHQGLLRLPMFDCMSELDQDRVIEHIFKFFKR